MGFVGVYRAIYDYAPQNENELEISDGDLLFILEKSTEDAWWKAKKKANNDDDDEPEGLVPNTYVEEVCFAPQWSVVATQILRGMSNDASHSRESVIGADPHSSAGNTGSPSKGPFRLYQADRRRALLQG